MIFYYSDKTWHRLAQLLLLVLAALVLFTFRDYGVSWDEEIQSQYGQAIVDYYQSWFVDQRYDQIFNLYLYGGMFDGLASTLDRYSPLGIYPTRHLLNAIFGLLGLWGTWRLGRLLSGSSAAGFVALSLLALTPMYYGHMFNNPKDIPFAAGIIWSLYYMGKTLLEPQVRIRTLFILGLVAGLTLGVRVGGVMLLGYWAIVLLAKRRDVRALQMIIGAGVVAYIIMLFCWPWAQQNPILNPLRALSEFSNFPQDVEVLLDGTIYRSTQLPWSYLPTYFGVQLPLLLSIPAVLSFLSLPYIWRRLEKEKRSLLALILMMMLLPVVYALIHRPALYDAVRHFLFVVPLLCIFTALGLQRTLPLQEKVFGLVARCRAGRCFANTARLALFAVIILHISVMVRLHPYEYIYVNSLQGGVAGAFGKYELDYWGSSFKEAAEKLQAYVAQEGGVPPGKIYKIAICGPWASAMIYLPPDYEAVTAEKPADFFLSTTRWRCEDMRQGAEIIRIARMGAPLAIVKDMRTKP